MGINMKKQFISPSLIILVAVLIVASRLLSDDGFDWLTIIALILLFISIGDLFNVFRRSK